MNKNFLLESKRRRIGFIKYRTNTKKSEEHQNQKLQVQSNQETANEHYNSWLLQTEKNYKSTKMSESALKQTCTFKPKTSSKKLTGQIFANVHTFSATSETDDSFATFSTNTENQDFEKFSSFPNKNLLQLSSTIKKETSISDEPIKKESSRSPIKWLPLKTPLIHQNLDDDNDFRMGPIWKKPTNNRKKTFRSETVV